MKLVNKNSEKLHRELAFTPTLSVDDGVRQVLYVLRDGIFSKMYGLRYRNVHYVVQQCYLDSNLIRK